MCTYLYIHGPCLITIWELLFWTWRILKAQLPDVRPATCPLCLDHVRDSTQDTDSTGKLYANIWDRNIDIAILIQQIKVSQKGCQGEDYSSFFVQRKLITIKLHALNPSKKQFFRNSFFWRWWMVFKPLFWSGLSRSINIWLLSTGKREAANSLHMEAASVSWT